MFSVALAKRRDDLVLSEGLNQGLTEGPGLTFRTAQAGYSKQFIDTAKAVSFAVTLVAYLLYSALVEQRVEGPFQLAHRPVVLDRLHFVKSALQRRAELKQLDEVRKT